MESVRKQLKKTETDGAAARQKLEAEVTALTESLEASQKALEGAEKKATSSGKLLSDASAELATRKAESVERNEASIKATERMKDLESKLALASEKEAQMRAELDESNASLEEAGARAAEARNAVAALVLKEVKPTRSRDLMAATGGGTKEEQDNQRLRSVVVRQEADREIAVILEREEALKTTVQKKDREIAHVCLERDRALTDAANTKRMVCVCTHTRRGIRTWVHRHICIIYPSHIHRICITYVYVVNTGGGRQERGGRVQAAFSRKSAASRQCQGSRVYARGAAPGRSRETQG